MKGLALTYSKDMQEDKEGVFDAASSLHIALAAMTGMIGDTTINIKEMAKAAGSGYSIATDLADWLVREADIPFRQAHHITGRAVALAETKQCGLEELKLGELQSIDARIDARVFDVLSVENSVKSRTSFGGTAPENVVHQIAWWRERLSQ